MSTLSKVTFGATCVVCAFTIYGVYEYQGRERAALRLGPIRDAERVRKKHEAHEAEAPVLTPQQLTRQAEYELQKKLQEQYQQVQSIDYKNTQFGPEKPTGPTSSS